MFSLRFKLFPHFFFNKKSLGGGGYFKNISFNVSSHFMLFQTFLEKLKIRGGGCHNLKKIYLFFSKGK